MLELNDPLWQTLEGGYRAPYDASGPLWQLENGTREPRDVLTEFWNELHHQHDVDLASYAAVPHLVRIAKLRKILDWNLFGLVACIEDRRLYDDNPPLPDELAADYHAAIKDLAVFGGEYLSGDWDDELTTSYLAVVAFAKNLPAHGHLLVNFEDDQIKEMTEKYYDE